jgi:hypothetical protein
MLLTPVSSLLGAGGVKIESPTPSFSRRLGYCRIRLLKAEFCGAAG